MKSYQLLALIASSSGLINAQFIETVSSTLSVHSLYDPPGH
jgi:energy-converting hydrogenase Eha subunit H